MNQQDQHKLLNNLYQKGNQEQPPAALDELILKQAQQSNQMENTSRELNKKNNWQPWLAAASVVLAIPMIWLLTQNQELSQDIGQIQSFESQAVKSQEVAPKAEAFASDTVIQTEQRNTTTGNHIKPIPSSAPSPMADSQQASEEQAETSITGKPIDQQSVQANKTLLLNEFKAKKRSLKPNNLDPIMALEIQQFNQLIEQGDVDSAEQLLNSIMLDHPDFDYQDLLSELATKKSKQ